MADRQQSIKDLLRQVYVESLQELGQEPTEEEARLATDDLFREVEALRKELIERSGELTLCIEVDPKTKTIKIGFVAKKFKYREVLVLIIVIMGFLTIFLSATIFYLLVSGGFF